MKIVLAVFLALTTVNARDAPPAGEHWADCKVSVGKKSVLTIDEENLLFGEWPDCHVKIYQSHKSDTLYIRKENKQLWWESYGNHQAIGNGFHKWLPASQLEITVVGDQITVTMGPNAQVAEGLCFLRFAKTECVEAWGIGGPPPPL